MTHALPIYDVSETVKASLRKRFKKSDGFLAASYDLTSDERAAFQVMDDFYTTSPMQMASLEFSDQAIHIVRRIVSAAADEYLRRPLHAGKLRIRYDSVIVYKSKSPKIEQHRNGFVRKMREEIEKIVVENDLAAQLLDDLLRKNFESTYEAAKKS